MGFWDGVGDALGVITDPFTGKSVHPYKYDTSEGDAAIRRQSKMASQQARGQGYALAAGAGASPAALRTAQIQGARAQQQIGQQAMVQQGQFRQQMEALRGQAAMQSQMANAQLDAQRDSSLMGLAATGIGAAALFSDPRGKEDVIDLSFGDQPVRPRPSQSYNIEDTPSWETPAMNVMSGYSPNPSRSQFIAPAQPSVRSAGGMQETAPVSPQPPDQMTAATAGGAAAGAAGGGSGAAMGALMSGAQGMIGSGSQGLGLSATNMGNYRGIDFTASDPRAKRDVQYVSSGLESKRDVNYVSSGLESKREVRPAYGEALGGSAEASFSPTDAAAEVPAISFRYKPEIAAREGVSPDQRMVGSDASEMAQNPLYAHSVKQGTDGMLRVDTGQATMANVAATSDLARRVKALESGAPGTQRAPGGSPATQRPAYGEALMGPDEQLQLEDRILSETASVQGDNRMAGTAQRQMQRSAPGRIRYTPQREQELRKRPGQPDFDPFRSEPQYRQPAGRVQAARSPVADAPSALPRAESGAFGSDEEELFVRAQRKDPRYDTEGFASPHRSDELQSYARSLRTKSDDEPLDPASEDADLKIGGVFNAAALQMKQTKPGSSDRRKWLRDLSDNLNRQRSGPPPARLIYDRLRDKIPNLTQQEVNEALRDEFDT